MSKVFSVGGLEANAMTKIRFFIYSLTISRCHGQPILCAVLFLPAKLCRNIVTESVFEIEVATSSKERAMVGRRGHGLR